MSQGTGVRKRIRFGLGIKLFIASVVVPIVLLLGAMTIVYLGSSSADTAHLMSTMVLAVVLFFVVLGILYVFMRRMIVTSVTKVSDILRDLAEGEGNLDASIPVRSRDEVGQVAESFNLFMEKLRGIIGNVKSATGMVAREKAELVVNTEQTAAAASQITGNLSSINRQIQSMNSEIQSVAQAMGSVTDSVAGLNQSATNQSAAVEEATASIEEMIASIRNVASTILAKKDASEHLTELISQTGANVSSVAQANVEVSGLVNRIFEMSSVISSIAAQTNLLAMNAAIEAAHAGEAGRGFAVVADEIRKLAENSAKSSKEIVTKVKEILQKVSAAAELARSSESAFVTLGNETRSTIQALEEINQATQELTIGGEQIIQANNDLNKSTVTVYDNVKSIEATVTTVTRSTTQAAEVAASVSAGMNEIGVGVGEIATSVNHIQEISRQLSDSTSQLEGETGKFTMTGGAKS